MLNHVTLKGPLPRHALKLPGSHQEVDCFIFTKLCLGEFFWNNHFWLMCKVGKLRDGILQGLPISEEMTRIWRPSCARKDIESEEFSAIKWVLSTMQYWDMNLSVSHSCCPVDLVFPLSTLWMIPKVCVDTQVPHSFSPALALESGKAIVVSTSYLRLSGTKNSPLRRRISDLHFWLT